MKIFIVKFILISLILYFFYLKFRTERLFSMPDKSKNKQCDRCNSLVDIRYRVQYQESRDWVMICRECWKQVKDDSQYRYGGTWKAKKK